MYEATLSLVEPDLVLSLFGTRDQHLRTVREALGVTITYGDGKLRVSGEEAAVTQATEVLERLKEMAERHGMLNPDEVSKTLATVTSSDGGEASRSIDVVNAGRSVRPRTAGQAKYVESIQKNDVVFSIGPAGTGKTYLAVAMAVEALKHQTIRKIVLVRPAVEAGESLGFLPGDLHAKINPYLRPLLDALHEMIDYDQIKHLMQQDVIEVIPLAYMRGRTLNEAFIILDEAQNATVAQMKMFLTRMGQLSRIVIAGDTTQVDLPPQTRSGLMDAIERLGKIQGIGIVHLTKADIVRHRLVEDIVQAYDEVLRGNGGKRGRR